ncbi:MAG: DUF3108 domain-containing protein [Bacteroidales bacterium]|nr:DUF3108 domain-containing protein [Bacteroidales bacterium]
MGDRTGTRKYRGDRPSRPYGLISLLIYSFLFTSHLLPLTVFSQELTPIRNEAFTHGEYLEYSVYYDSYITGKVTAGIATAEVKFESKEVNGRQTYHLIGTGKTKGAFNLFFKVEDRFESFVDRELLVPWKFIRRTKEGDYEYDDDVKFNQFTGSYSSTRKNKSMPKGTQDLISALYIARTYDISNAQPGDDFPITFLLDDSIYVSVIRYMGSEDVIVELGTFRCLRFQPLVVAGNIFSQPYPMDVWITDDKNHIPLLIKSAVIIGSVKLELSEYKGLANPFTSMIAPKEKEKSRKKKK